MAIKKPKAGRPRVKHPNSDPVTARLPNWVVRRMNKDKKSNSSILSDLAQEHYKDFKPTAKE